jgi:hypothetical protein
LSSLPSGLGALPSLVSSLPTKITGALHEGVSSIRELTSIVPGQRELVGRGISGVVRDLVPPKPLALPRGIAGPVSLGRITTAPAKILAQEHIVPKGPKFLDKTDPMTKFKLRGIELDSEDIAHQPDKESEEFEDTDLDSIQEGIKLILNEETSRYGVGYGLSSGDSAKSLIKSREFVPGNLRLLKRAFEEILSKELTKYGITT